MRILFYCVGVMAFLVGSVLVVVTALGTFPALTGYSAGFSVGIAGVISVIAGRKDYRGHWAFLTGITLTTLALAAFGGEIDAYLSDGKITDLSFGLFLASMFLTFGVLSLSSSYRLHRCLLRLAEDSARSSYEDYSI